MQKHATISECGQYRYALWRDWGSEPTSPMLLYVMLNPSTADAELDDPTIRRCIGFAKREGYTRLGVINLFAYRATDPKELTRDKNVIGPKNVVVSEAMLRFADKVILGWGANKYGVNLGEAWLVRYKHFEHKFYCLGRTKAGCPRHPLMIRNDAPLEKYP